MVVGSEIKEAKNEDINEPSKISQAEIWERAEE